MKISKKKAYIFKMNLWTANIFSIAVFVIMAIITILLISIFSKRLEKDYQDRLKRFKQRLDNSENE